MIEKTSCQQCGTHIEFDIDHANQFVACPSCGQQTRLILPAKPKAEFQPAKFPSKLISCPDCLHQVSKEAFSCPECGRMIHVPYRIVRTVVGHFYWMTLLYTIAAFIIGWLVKELIDVKYPH